MELFHHVINNSSPLITGLALMVAVYSYLTTYTPPHGTKLHSCLGKPSACICGSCPVMIQATFFMHDGASLILALLLASF